MIIYAVYVLWSKEESKFYIGFTSDIERRIKEHRSGKVHTTKRYKSLNLIYYEKFVSEVDARRREKYFKTTQGKKGLRLILRDTIK